MTDSAGFSIHALELGPMENFVYLIQDHATGRAAVVDPAWEAPQVLALAERLGVRITDILLTHSHHDHINGIEEVLARFDAELHLMKDEARFWGAELQRPSLHHGGDIIEVGATPIRLLHTPGHTPGSACYGLPGNVITGDTLFVFGCGRCDLRGGDPEQMYHTLKRLAEDLPGDTIIHPGHNYSVTPVSSMSEQIEGNPFLHFDHVEPFIEYRMRWHDQHRHSPYAAVTRENLYR